MNGLRKSNNLLCNRRSDVFVFIFHIQNKFKFKK